MSYPSHLLPSVTEIYKHLPSELADMPVLVYPTIDSTNTEMRRLMMENMKLKRPCLLVAHMQTAGKGRLGRSFYSPLGSGLYMTLAYRVEGALEQAVSVTSAAAVATAEAIEAVCHKHVLIKWVNDLYLNGKKICGILTEAVACEGGYHILVGIGINVTTREFPEDMRNPAGAVLSETDPYIDQSLLCADITQKLFYYLDPNRTGDCLRSYRSRFMLTGQRVVCSRNFSNNGESDPQFVTEGTVVGVDDQFGLILHHDNGTEVLRGGEISVNHGVIE